MKVTNPNPLDLPVSRSTMTLASMTSPYLWKASLKLVSSVLYERPPMKSFADDMYLNAWYMDGLETEIPELTCLLTVCRRMFPNFPKKAISETFDALLSPFSFYSPSFLICSPHLPSLFPFSFTFSLLLRTPPHLFLSLLLLSFFSFFLLGSFLHIICSYLFPCFKPWNMDVWDPMSPL